MVSLSNTGTGVDTGYVRQEGKSEGIYTRAYTFSIKSFKERPCISLVNFAPCIVPNRYKLYQRRPYTYSSRVGERRVGGR